MDILSLLADSAWLTAIATLLGSVATYFVTKSNNKKEVTVTDRLQLSKDQYQLIAELREMMKEQRAEIDGLREEIKQLQEVNVALTIENKELQSKIGELMTRLDRP